MKTFLAVCLAGMVLGSAADAGEPAGPTAGETLIYAGWQAPYALPRRFRHHCKTDGFGAEYCADKCGTTYQFYYCSNVSFGCCHIGVGYCGGDGHLRCFPWETPLWDSDKVNGARW